MESEGRFSREKIARINKPRKHEGIDGETRFGRNILRAEKWPRENTKDHKKGNGKGFLTANRTNHANGDLDRMTGLSAEKERKHHSDAVNT